MRSRSAGFNKSTGQKHSGRGWRDRPDTTPGRDPACREDAEVAGQGEDLPDAGQQFIKIIGNRVGAFEPFAVEGKTFDQVLAKTLRGPLAELSASIGVNAVTDCDDHFKVVVIDHALNLASSLDLNYSIFSNSCPGQQLPIPINLFNMVIYGIYSDMSR